MVPGITHIFVKKIHEKYFEEFTGNAISERYNLICSIDVHEKNDTSVHYYGSSGSGYTITLTSTTGALVSLSATIGFVGCWMQTLEHNLL